MSLEKLHNSHQSNLDKHDDSGFDNSNTEDVEKQETEKLQKDIEKFKTEAEEILRANKFLYESFSDSITPKLKFSDGVKINFKTMTIHLDTGFFYKNGFTEKQMLWATYHELSHFKDLISDPERFMENFKHIRAKADEYGKKIRDITGEPEQEFTEEEKKSGKIDHAVAQAYDGWHTFYNCLDDIYVNSLVERGVYSYSQKGRDHSEIADLYSRVLFKETDYSKLPKSRQFSYAMLRKAMLPEDDLQLDPAVSEILKKEIKFGGKKMTVEEMIGSIQSKTRRGVKAGSRYFMIQKTLEPIFEEFYNQDLEEWAKRRQEGESGGSSGDPFDDEFDPKNSKKPKEKPTIPGGPGGIPRDLDDEDIDDIINKINQFKENPNQKEQKPSKEEQEAERERKLEEQIQKWCDENEINRETLRRFEEIQTEISPYLSELSKVWDSIIYGRGSKFAKETEASNQGDINVSRFIKYFPDIEAGRMRDVRPMDRKTMKQLPADKPETVRIRFVGDASGSMSDDPSKHDVLEKAYVLIMTSLRDFETKLNRTRSKNHSKLTVQTEGWLFGNEAVKIKEFRKGRDYQSEYTQIIRQFQFLRQNLGYTVDSDVYKRIAEELSSKDVSDTKSGKIMDLVLEVTDGVSTDRRGDIDTESVDKNVSVLENHGSIVRSFQIGKVSEESKEIFNKIWNKNNKQRGHVVGSEVENLLPAIKDALKQYMSNVKI